MSTIGIDVSKDRLDVFIDDPQSTHQFPNHDFAPLCRQLRAAMPERIIVEASGGYEVALVAALAAADLPVVVVNPRRVRDFARATGQLAKTDRLDARLLAHFGRVTAPPIRPLKDAETQLLQALLTRRQQLIVMRTAEVVRLDTAHPKLHKPITKHIAVIARQTERLDAEIAALIHDSDLWRARDDLHQSCPGVGPVCSQALLAYLPELGTLSAKEIASLAGLAPMTRQSGVWRGKDFIQAGRARLRAVLYMAALTATRHNEAIKRFYLRLVAKGKPKKVALVACAHKLLTILNAMVRDQTPWTPPISNFSG